MADRSRFHIGRHVAYVPTPTELSELGGSAGDTWPARILGVSGGDFLLKVLRPDARVLHREVVSPSRVDLTAPPTVLEPFSLVATAPPTHHLEVGNVGNAVLASTPGTPEAAALAFFGQLHVHVDQPLAVIHLHYITVSATGSDVTVEVYLGTDVIPGPPTLTLIATLTQPTIVGGDEFQTQFAIPSVTDIPANSYFFAQALSKNANFDGLTIDFHFGNW